MVMEFFILVKKTYLFVRSIVCEVCVSHSSNSTMNSTESRIYKGVVVAPHVPRSQGGLYWGYSVRLASGLSMYNTHTAMNTLTHRYRHITHTILSQYVQNVHLTLFVLNVTTGTVFTECPYKEGYDLTIGTSEKGCNIDQASIKPFK